MEETVRKTDWNEVFTRPTAAAGNLDPAQGGRLQDAVRTRIRREGRRPRAAEGHHRRRLDRSVSSARWPRRRATSPTSSACRFRSGRWPPTSRPARPSSSAAAACPGDARQHVGPGAIAPVEIDGRLLVDGGIANNLPIDEARKLCARRGDRGQYLHAAAQARGDHVRAERSLPAHQLPRQGDRRRSS